jgi:hypothetical protein
MLTKLQAAAQIWEKLLFYSGGSLNLEKCSWHMMYWQWEKGRPVMRSHESTDDGTISLTCQDTTEPRVTIKNTSTDEATRILGVYISPTGDYTKQIQILKQKADRMAINLHASRLTATETNIFLKTTYAPSMRYVLPALAIDEERINEVQTKILGVSLQKLGMSSKTPTAIRHAPTTMGGLGMIDLRTELGISTIKLLCDNVYKGSEVGKLILHCLQVSTNRSRHTRTFTGLPEHPPPIHHCNMVNVHQTVLI